MMIYCHFHCLTVGLECSEEGGEQRAADADVHQLRQGVQSQLRGEVVQERVRVLSLVLLHQLDHVLHRGMCVMMGKVLGVNYLALRIPLML